MLKRITQILSKTSKQVKNTCKQKNGLKVNRGRRFSSSFPNSLSLSLYLSLAVDAFANVTIDALDQLSYCLSKAQSYEQALATVEFLLTQCPNHTAAIIRKALCLVMIGKKDAGYMARELVKTIEDHGAITDEYQVLLQALQTVDRPAEEASAPQSSTTVSRKKLPPTPPPKRPVPVENDDPAIPPDMPPPRAAHPAIPPDMLDSSLDYKTLSNKDLPPLPSNPPTVDINMEAWQQFQRLKTEYQTRGLPPKYAYWSGGAE